MAIVTYDSVAQHVAPYVVACPTPVITDAMRKAAIEFYDRSTAYRTWLPAFDLTASTADYTLSGFPSETELAQLLELSCNGVRLEPVSHEIYVATDPSGTATDTRPSGYFIVDKPTVTVTPTPTETVTSGMRAFVAVKPTRASTGVEELYMNQFREYLVNGTLAMLQLLPDRPWSNPQMATYNRARFDAGIALARMQANKGVARTDLRVIQRVWV